MQVLDPLLPLTVPFGVQLKSVGSVEFTVSAAAEPIAVEVTVTVLPVALAVKPGDVHAAIAAFRFGATVVVVVLLM